MTGQRWTVQLYPWSRPHPHPAGYCPQRRDSERRPLSTATGSLNRATAVSHSWNYFLAYCCYTIINELGDKTREQSTMTIVIAYEWQVFVNCYWVFYQHLCKWSEHCECDFVFFARGHKKDWYRTSKSGMRCSNVTFLHSFIVQMSDTWLLLKFLSLVLL